MFAKSLIDCCQIFTDIIILIQISSDEQGNKN
jgi:hypothetical protein